MTNEPGRRNYLTCGSDSQGDGIVKVTLREFSGEDIFPGVVVEVSRDASLGQLQYKVSRATGNPYSWLDGKFIAIGDWVHCFAVGVDDDVPFMQCPQVREQVRANQLEATVVKSIEDVQSYMCACILCKSRRRAPDRYVHQGRPACAPPDQLQGRPRDHGVSSPRRL